jgi:hypothetical protein
MTTMNLLDKWSRVRVWIRKMRTKDPLAKISAREALTVAAEFRKANLPGLDPELELELPPGSVGANRARGARMRLPDGTFVAGRQITHITRNADGTETIIQVED